MSDKLVLLHQQNVHFSGGVHDTAATVIQQVEAFIRLSTLHGLLSCLAALVTLWVMQTMTFDAGLSSRMAVYRMMQRIGMCLLAMALAMNGVTPFVITDSPWLTDVVVVFSLLVVLIVSGLMHRHRRQSGTFAGMD